MKEKNIKYPAFLDLLSDIFSRHGHTLYIVGGYVRDALLGFESDDIDICSDALPEDVMHMLNGADGFALAQCCLPLGTIIIRYKGVSLEYTAFRRESYRGDGTHTPDEISFGATLEEDASRRDFTCNSIYYSIIDNEIIDLFGGRDDIENKTMRTTRPPHEVFSEDALRILRMARISAETLFIPKSDVIDSAKVLKKHLLNLSRERILREMEKLLCADEKYPSNGREHIMQGLRVLFESEAAHVLFVGIDYERALLCASAKSYPAKAALFAASCDDINSACEYICPNGEIKREVLFLIGNMNYKDEKALNLLTHNGYLKGRLLEEMLEITETPHANLSKYLSKMKRSDYIISMKTLAVTGNDIKEILDMKNSPEIGEIKLKLLSHIIEHPEENTKDALINILQRLAYPASISSSHLSNPE